MKPTKHIVGAYWLRTGFSSPYPKAGQPRPPRIFLYWNGGTRLGKCDHINAGAARRAAGVLAKGTQIAGLEYSNTALPAMGDAWRAFGWEL